MGIVAIKILQGSAVTQNVLHTCSPFIPHLQV